jgi:hypothetical protein
MTKQKNTPAYVTREILKEEISAWEGRLDAKINSRFNQLDAKIETTSQSLKEYTDSRFNRSDARTDTLDAKMTKYFELMMQTLTDGNKGINKILFNHEGRITVLEGRGPQPGRI